MIHWRFLAGLLSGLLIAGVVSLIYWPFYQPGSSFLGGFIASLVLTLAILMVFYLRERATHEAKVGARSSWGSVLISSLLLLTGLGLAVFFLKSSETQRERATFRKQLLAQQKGLSESIRISGHIGLMTQLLQKVQAELDSSPGRELSMSTIDQIAAMSYMFKPHVYLADDGFPEKLYSPERGHLLLMLSKMNIDSGSLQRILEQTTFEDAVLRGADLSGARLNGIDLRGADLNGINLMEAQLSHSNLKEANLESANLSHTILDSANLVRANLSWSYMNRAVLNGANLDGANISSAQLKQVDFSNSILRWANLDHSNLQTANCQHANLFKTSLRKANLTETSFLGSDLEEAILSDAIINKTNFHQARLPYIVVRDSLWISRLVSLDVPGADSIQIQYQIKPYAMQGLFWLVRKDVVNE